MESIRERRLRAGLAALVGVIVVAGGVRLLSATAGAAAPPVPGLPTVPVLAWSRVFPGVVFRESSPVAAQLATRAAVVGAHDGRLYAFDLLTGATEAGWPVQTAAPINSSPAAADLTGDGRDEVFVGSGYADAGRCSGGGVYAVDAAGHLAWRANGSDRLCADLAFHSSPAIGDVTGHGGADVTIGALGLESWSFDATTGRLNSGWPLATDDTVFSSPALADANGDGVPDIIMGGDSSPGGLIDHRGGVVRAVRGDGHVLWSYFTDEIVRSSPAVGDLDGNGHPTIVFGTGDYWVHQPGGSRDATRVFAVTPSGQLRWSRDLGGITMGSPALADVGGTGRPDVVIGTADGPEGGEVWVLDANGQPLPHWAGHPSGGGVVIGGITTADVNGDGAQDLLVPTGRGVFVYDGRTGNLLFTLALNQVGFQSSPLVTDDGGGVIGITTAGTTAYGTGVVQHWRLLPTSGARIGALAWPMFHHDPRHTGNLNPPPSTMASCKGRGVSGYWMAARDGGVFGFCGAGFHGGAASRAPVVSMASTPSGNGYWEAAADGGVFAYGDAVFAGAAANVPLRAPIVSIARTPTGRGYWLASSDGGVYAFGDAPFFGSAGTVRLPFRVISILATESGRGYWLVGSDGTVLTYGDARFYGSPAGLALRQPIVAAAATPTGLGYWLVAADGGVFTYGDAPFFGSTGGLPLNQPIAAIGPTAAGRGYWLVAGDGGVFSFGDAPFLGSLNALRLDQPVSAVAVRSG